jgi:Leu/Phe-tRNA-protein transferase
MQWYHRWERTLVCISMLHIHASLTAQLGRNSKVKLKLQTSQVGNKCAADGLLLTSSHTSPRQTGGGPHERTQSGIF